MKTFKLFFPVLVLIFLIANCAEKIPQNPPAEKSSLKAAYKDDFYIGAALNRSHINESVPEAAKIIEKEFNTITAENVMKWMHIHPGRDSFNFDMPDKFVALGEKNNMFVIGHTLVWHSQLGRWAWDIKEPEEMKAVLENHISTIVGRYKGKVHGWDVVNEALNEDGTLRKTVFLDALGEDYLKLAFDLAAKADPEAELYYNDYSLTNPAKRAGVIRLVKQLQESGTKIDGVGMQAHWGLTSPSIEEIENSILEYSALGVKVMFTELDVDVLPNPRSIQGADINQSAENSELLNPYTAGLPDSVQTQQAQRYEDIFRLFLKHQDKITRVTFWGVDDGHSWKNNFPVRGRTNYPLIFDREYRPKEAYERILGLK